MIPRCLAISFKGYSFKSKVSFALTINRSQVQTFSLMDILLPDNRTPNRVRIHASSQQETQ
ncbi:unnamed protein product [Acanthoscelides obtectus]|uniref:Uncharacterized protein n=1 Tax=Acanthoscelides obtectus TaxID=200917 RepID=A0A9P0KRR3_ACAOB|nr:unnamed protein product [Acanthoscelides obtectus]CAK1655106.1 hypothetical protein AOBTE_LOCUS19029 [Acanthoscelides obtectus]